MLQLQLSMLLKKQITLTPLNKTFSCSPCSSVTEHEMASDVLTESPLLTNNTLIQKKSNDTMPSFE